MAVTLRTLDIPSSSSDDDGNTNFVHILSDLLSEQECISLIHAHTDLKPSNLTLGTIRTREQFMDPTMASMLWERIREFYDGFKVEDEAGGMWVAEGLNPHFRISKYEKRTSYAL